MKSCFFVTGLLFTSGVFAPHQIYSQSLPVMGEWALVQAVSNGNSLENITGSLNFKSASVFCASVERGSCTGESDSWYEIVGNVLKPAINESIIWFGRSFGFSRPGRNWSTDISCTQSEFLGFAGYAIGWSPSNENILISLSDDTLTISIEGKATFFKYTPATPTNVATGAHSNLPSSIILSQNYPNPFNPETTIKYELPQTTHARITVYNLTGRKVVTLVDRDHLAGTYITQWNGQDELGRAVASGVYLYKLQTDDFVQNRKLTLLR